MFRGWGSGSWGVEEGLLGPVQPVPCASRCGQAGCHLSEATVRGRPSPLLATRTQAEGRPGDLSPSLRRASSFSSWSNTSPSSTTMCTPTPPGAMALAGSWPCPPCSASRSGSASRCGPLPLASLLFSAICKALSHKHFACLPFFFLEMVLIPASCTMS